MRKKQTIVRQAIIEDYAAEGKSIVRIDGKVIFVDGAVPGDKVDIQLTKSKKDWAEGRVIFFHELSGLRTDPFCTHFGVCGGCKWQMLPYTDQLKFKQREVEQNLKRIGRIQLPDIQPILGADMTRRYRNKLEFTFSNKRYLSQEEFELKKGQPFEPALGYHIPKWFDKVIDINECHLQEEPSNQIRNVVREIALENQFSFYDIRMHQGWLRNLIIRYATTGELMVNLCIGFRDDAALKILFDGLRQKVPQISTLLFTINPKVNDSIHDLMPEVYDGKGYIIENLEDFQFKIGPKSFFQTNTRQGIKLYHVAREYAELTGDQTLYDLYCGTGSIGIFLSRQAKKVIGVEVISEAIEDAKENARLNQVKHAHFIAGDAAALCNEVFFSEYGKPDVIITDPPRAGMHEKLVQSILAANAPTVVYVSCNSATQARDLQLMDEKYMVTKVQPVDMFPHTHHIENVVQLKLRQQN
ncbi:MAG: 23S rRNA (uracil(1939)-C(5))-methyltransferase RlmD [Chitinophagaceae bacterium]